MSERKESDIIVANIAGGFTELNTHNRNNFGALFSAYLKAADIDILILTINLGLDLEKVKKEVEKLKLQNIPYVVLIATEYQYDDTMMESFMGVKSIPMKSTQKVSFAQQLQSIFPEDYVLGISEVEK